jgi:hypothetical protein
MDSLSQWLIEMHTSAVTEGAVYHWKDPKDLIPQAVGQVHDFLRAHQPATAAR